MRSLRDSAPLGAIALFLPLVAASSPAQDGQERVTVQAQAAGSHDQRRTRVLEALEAGDYEGAHALLGAILFDDYVATAQEYFAASDPREGMLWIDRALVLRPDDVEGLLVRGDGSLSLGDVGAAEGETGLFVLGAYEDALTSYREAIAAARATEPRVRALFGAAGAATKTGDADAALRYARAGWAALEESEETIALPTAPERTLAEVTYFAYTQSKGAGDDAVELYGEAEAALFGLLGSAPEDPWAWLTLSRLQRWEGRDAEALETVQRGLDRAPDDTTLLAELSAAARSGAADGDPSGAAVAAYDAFLARYADSALGHWYRALERFNDAAWKLSQSEPDPALFTKAETDFARCRELDETWTDSCQGYESMCRSGVGWCAYHAGDLDAAIAAFQSMEQVMTDGMQWSIEGQLLSGVQGLEFAAAKYNETEDFGGAARVFDILRGYETDEVKWANNAGFFHRDAGVAAELLARRVCRAAAGEPLPQDALQAVLAREPTFRPEPQLCLETAERLRQEAWEHMRKSIAAYHEAARLSPEDVRVVNDTALVLIYYLQDDLDRAEKLLQRCMELGAEQMESADELDEDALFELKNAWGDAYQNMGVLYLRRGDLETARGFLQKSVEIGPEARPMVTQMFLPYCDGEADAIAFVPTQDGIRDWAAPCRP